MSDNPGVSVLINSYNYERYLPFAIESALQQSHPRIQVVVVDDGSTDGSQEIIRSFGDRVESHVQENQGQTAACRRALALARHEIVIFLDADDLLEPEAAAQVAAIWHAGVVKVQYSLKVIDEHGVFSGNIFPKYPRSMTPEKVLADIYRSGSYQDSPTSGNAFSRTFLEEVMPHLIVRHAPDGDLNGLAPLYGDVLTIPEPLGCYRIHGENSFAQSKLDVGRFKEYIQQSKHRVAFLRDHYRTKNRIIDEDVLNRDMKYLEYRLMVARLDPAGDRSMMDVLKILFLIVRASRFSSQDLVRRMLRMVWVAAVALSPRPLSRLLAEQRYVPGRRWSWITNIASRTRPTGGLQPR